MIPVRYAKIETIDDNQLSPVDMKNLDAAVSGMNIVGAEPVCYPLTDAVLLYLENQEGESSVLEICGGDPMTARMGQLHE